MEPIAITQISEAQLNSFDHLVEESLAQGFRFIEKLLREYYSGFNRFEKIGEILLGASVGSVIVGIGGLNQDPYSQDPQIGRLRHLYVESAWRRRGVGRLLVTRLIQEATLHYQFLTLRTDTAAADMFYQKLGFKTDSGWEHTTHFLQLGFTAR